ncbi:MAG: dienelactone hydrolase family protein [Jatrophihabitans sp.]
MSDDLAAATTTLQGADGAAIESYLARPVGPKSRGGVVVIHHLPGYDGSTKEIVRRFAVLGYDAICPNLYSRQAPDLDPTAASALVREAGGITDEQLVSDVGTAADHLRQLDSNNGKVGVIGYCSGGRQSLLAATQLDPDAAVDCYGAFVVNPPPAEYALKATPLTDELASLSCPLLGLFGNDDRNPGPDEVNTLEQRLRELGKDVEFHRYDGAGHGFFSPDGAKYQVGAATDGWSQIEQFFQRHLADSGPSGR